MKANLVHLYNNSPGELFAKVLTKVIGDNEDEDEKIEIFESDVEVNFFDFE